MGDHAKEHSDGLYGEIRSYALERIEGEFSCVADGVLAGTRNDLIYCLFQLYRSVLGRLLANEDELERS